MRKDSAATSFSIVRQDYESDEKKEEIRSRKDNEAEPPIPLTNNFFSTKKPLKVSTVEKISDCVKLVTVAEFRKTDFKMPERARSTLFIFTKKLEDGMFLKWDALLMVTE
ncbi:hypothetical protein SAMN06265219_112160 [Gracilimonas mengyeensis]|uniref:Uncharacterized protein n=2 Tax=Gracilimonas mengyeensis TaxID=1302730 RepID=A0A521EMF5_9BACT|nr:hypothetical protein SAMN06265219_112160 [Gracilimonas mengyeensis]